MMSLAVFSMLTAIYYAKSKPKNWLKKHRVFALLGSLSAIFAFICIFTLKFKMHYMHFVSPHAILGGLGLTLLILTPLSGILIFLGVNSIRNLHKYFGRITASILIITAIMGIDRFLEISKK